MSYEDTVKALKVVSTLALGNYAGASLYTAIAVQPSLIEQPDVHNAAKVHHLVFWWSLSMQSAVKKPSYYWWYQPICTGDNLRLIL